MMLQRAASSAYSWWWASHIRTKQSKWIEQNLQDMEEKVAKTLKLIEEEGDSFARRAEMYFKNRPELINFVQESYRAYRALAERYDHISTELQNANTTIASYFPDQVPFEIDDDDDDYPRRPPQNLKPPNIPEVPKAPLKDLKSIVSSTVKKLRHKKNMEKKIHVPEVPKSGLTKAKALEKIDKVQKDILALQTEKEFVKSTYEGGLARYWEIEKQITELQGEVSALQDEFGASMVIEDDEARSVMTSAALRSCQESLVGLREKQRRSAEEAKREQLRIKEIVQKFESLKEEVEPDYELRSNSINLVFEELNDLKLEEEMKALEDKIKEQFEGGQKASLTVTEMAEKIDELVNKVISLETAVSSQTVLIERLKTETDDFQSQIQILEDDKSALPKDNMKFRIKEMEEKLREVRDLNSSVKTQNVNLHTHFSEADCNLEHLTEKVKYVKPDDQQEVALLPNEVEPKTGHVSGNSTKESEVVRQSGVTACAKKDAVEQREGPSSAPDSIQTVDVNTRSSEKAVKPAARGESSDGTGPSPSTPNCRPIVSNDNSTEPQWQLQVEGLDPSQTSDSTSQLVAHRQTTAPDEPNWQEMFMKGMENREKTLLAEYTATLRNFKEMKRRLSEVENTSQNGVSDDTTEQLRELKCANASKDEEIRTLRKKLALLQSAVDEGKDAREKNDSTGQSESSAGEAVNKQYELILIDQSQQPSEVEEKLRMELDQLLEDNLDFWFRFSAAYNQIQKYETAVDDLRNELSKLEEKRKEEGSRSRAFSINSDVKPIYKHLSEIKTELTGWMEKCVHLKGEQQKRFSSLCHIQEEITKALKLSAEDEDFRFTSYQAAKFQGEILNMKHENNKVEEELQAGLDHMTVLQIEVEKTLAKLNEEFGLAGPNQTPSEQLNRSPSQNNQNRVPLRSFIFGTKPKKHRASIFTYVNPAMYKKYNGLRAAF